MDITDKLTILTAAAKYDVACTSSGSDRGGQKGSIGSTHAAGICHAFSSDGRCISLLKVLMTNYCVYDCQYCACRSSADIKRAAFTPEELAELTINFYRRNFIEGLFLSSGVIRNADYAMERMCKTIELLRNKYRFRGYIHAKAIPGASPELISKLGMLADRMSVNIELPSESSLKLLAPQKYKDNILNPMGQIRDGIKQNKHELAVYRHAPKFAPAGQSTQMIIGASPENDLQILRLTEGLYRKYSLKRVFFSAYIPVGNHALLPKNQPPPLLREHRLYQADWLLRFYGFKANEILDDDHPSLDPILDPKCNWAMNHLSFYPVEIRTADMEVLLRVPGIGVKSAQRIVKARRMANLTIDDLKKLGVVLKRAAYFITCGGKYTKGAKFEYDFIYHSLTIGARYSAELCRIEKPVEQLSFFGNPNFWLPPTGEDVTKCLTGQI